MAMNQSPIARSGPPRIFETLRANELDATGAKAGERREREVNDADLNARGRKLVAFMGGGSVAMLLVAGGLLWWRDGERLFTEGLISAIARCF